MSALQGKSVLVTRPTDQAKELVDLLEARGAKALVLPSIRIEPSLEPESLNKALQNLDSYDWVIFTSVNGVAAVQNQGVDTTKLSGKKLACIGPTTASALASLARQPDVVPEEFVSEAIVEKLGDVAGQRFLLPRADIARKDLAIELKKRGADVTEVAAYRIVADENPIPEDILAAGMPDYITLTSSSSVHGTLKRLKASSRDSWMRESSLACIGPITADTVRQLGFEVAISANEYTIPGLVEALEKHASSAMAGGINV